MSAVAHGWKPDRIKGPPVSVAKEFNQADKGSKTLARANTLRKRKGPAGAVGGAAVGGAAG